MEGKAGNRRNHFQSAGDQTCSETWSAEWETKKKRAGWSGRKMGWKEGKPMDGNIHGLEGTCSWWARGGCPALVYRWRAMIQIEEQWRACPEAVELNGKSLLDV